MRPQWLRPGVILPFTGVTEDEIDCEYMESMVPIRESHVIVSWDDFHMTKKNGFAIYRVGATCF